MVSVTFDNIKKNFGSTAAVKGVSLEIAEGELFFLLGPSGCGKTTCLRAAAGFEQPDSGRVLFGGADITNVPPHKRNAGMVFQSYALFPHMTVEKNIAFGLRFRKFTPDEKKRKIILAMERVQIPELAKRFPSQLSGGQQQRVALARALVIEPGVLLLDEPLSNLDAALRAEMRVEIRRIQRDIGITTIYVTHDQEDALSMADRIALMRSGEIAQIGSPANIYFKPQTSFAASFIGKTNLLEGTAAGADGAYILIDTPAGKITASAQNSQPIAPGSKTIVSIRPEHITAGTSPNSPNSSQPSSGAAPSSSANKTNRLDAVVENITFLGGSVRIDAKTTPGGIPVSATAQSLASPLGPGGAITLHFSPEDALALEN